AKTESTGGRCLSGGWHEPDNCPGHDRTCPWTEQDRQPPLKGVVLSGCRVAQKRQSTQMPTMTKATTKSPDWGTSLAADLLSQRTARADAEGLEAERIERLAAVFARDSEGWVERFGQAAQLGV